MATYSEVWKCCECGEIHDDEDGARECCMPRIAELYRCDLCESVHEDEEQAEKCCGVSGTYVTYVTCPSCYRDYRSNQIGAQAVLISGHCQTCNPSFTIDQQLAIEDLHFDRTGHRASLMHGE